MERNDKRIEKFEKNVAAHTAAAEENKGASDGVFLGKFKDVKSLYSAYGSLQAEFTRRSQRLRELERAVNGADNLQTATPQSAQGGRKDDDVTDDFYEAFPAALSFSDKIDKLVLSGEATNRERAYLKILEDGKREMGNKLVDSGFLASAALADGSAKRAVVEQYLREVVNSKPKFTGGAGKAFPTPPHRPKDLTEASAMAEKYLNNKGELKIW